MTTLYDVEVRPVRDHVIVSEMNFDNRVTKGGIILMSDDGKDEGIRPRWGKVYAIGPDQKDVDIGDWVLVEHGRWTRGVELVNGDDVRILRRVEGKSILLKTAEKPAEA